MRALLVGYFSTVGDLEVLRPVCRWLDAEGIGYDVGAFASPVNAELDGAIDIFAADPDDYTHLCLVCGPFEQVFFQRVGFDLDRFSHCTRIGVNLTMVADPDRYQPLDVVVGRDSAYWARPDLSLLEDVDRVPVVGLCLAPGQSEYGTRQRHQEAREKLQALVERTGAAGVPLDTRWPGSRNTLGWSSPEQFESVCQRVDVVLTTRLHGLVLALKNGVPAIAIDAIRGGDKVTRQGQAIGWAHVYAVETVTARDLDDAFAQCLDPETRALATSCASAAREAAGGIEAEFRAALRHLPDRRPAETPSLRPTWRQLLRRGRSWLRSLARS